MKHALICLLAMTLIAVPALAQSGTGTIKGRVHLTGELHGNPLIRMGMDPMCSKMAAGKQMVQEIVAADIKGNLANVFVSLKGDFPQSPVPSQPVKINQMGCMYTPRVVGMRLGQTLLVGNGDPVPHNVHSISASGNTFNISVPMSGSYFGSTQNRKKPCFGLRATYTNKRWWLMLAW